MDSNQSKTNNGVFTTPNIYEEISEKELFEFLKESNNVTSIVLILRELELRRQQTISDLESRIAVLENKTLKAKGRKKQDFFVDGRLLSDAEIVRLIDGEFYKDIRHLEKDVGANKNVLRNRYNKEKKRLEMLERQKHNQQQ